MDDQKEVKTSNTVENKKEKKKSKKPRFLTIVLFIIIVIFGIWAVLVYRDYGRIKRGEEPKNCWLGKSTQEYKKSSTYKGLEGTIDKCIGPGYKVVVYKTVAYKITEFVPFWEKDKTLDELSEV